MARTLAFGIAGGVVLAAVLGIVFLANAFPQKSSEPIRMGVVQWIGGAPTYIAYEKFFEKNGVEVELVKRTEISELRDDLLNGRVDAIDDVYTDAIIRSAGGFANSVVYVEDYSTTGDAIVSKYENLSDLKGRVIGVEGINTYAHLFVLKALERAGIYEKDVQIKSVPAGEVIEALDSGEIDAGYTWGAPIPEAVERGYNVVAEAQDVRGIITDEITFSAKTIEERPEDVQKVVSSLVQAREFIRTNHDEALKLLTKYYDSSEEELEAAFQSIHLLDLEDNKKAMQDSDELTSLYGAGRQITTFLSERGQLGVIPDLNNVIDPRFINNAAQAQ